MATKHISIPSVFTQEQPISRVALYARVSTLSHGQDPEMQLAELREYAARRGWIISSEYVDEGISGTVESRPQLNRLMTDAHRRNFDAVLCGRSIALDGLSSTWSTHSPIFPRMASPSSACETISTCPPLLAD